MSEDVTNHEPRTTNYQVEDNEISLLDLAIVLAKHKKLILGLPFAAAVIAAGISLLLPNIYTGTTKILPPQQSQSAAAAMLNQLNALGTITGQSFGIKNPNDIYVGMLRSRTVADNLVQQFDLKNIYGRDTLGATRTVLENATKITSGKDGLITIEVDDRNSKRAAELANGYVDELTKLTRVLAVTEASQRRLFFERQLAHAKESLAASEAATRQGLEKGGLAKVDEQGRAMVEVTGRLRGQISVKEVQISAMRAFAADRNPDLQMAQQELEALKRELGRIEGASPPATISKGAVVGSSGLDNLRRLRDMKYYETIYELLAKQYEIAKIDEARDTSLIQVLDRAIVPETRSRPARTRIVIVTAFVVGLLAVLFAIFSEVIQRARKDPQHAEQFDVLRRHVWGK